MSVYFGEDIPVYLIAILSKGERANFTAAEIAAFRSWTIELKRIWRGKEQ